MNDVKSETTMKMPVEKLELLDCGKASEGDEGVALPAAVRVLRSAVRPGHDLAARSISRGNSRPETPNN